jgi:hypothetical protein
MPKLVVKLRSQLHSVLIFTSCLSISIQPHIHKKNVATEHEAPLKSEVFEWMERGAHLEDMSGVLNRLFRRMTFCANRKFLYDLYPYVCDTCGVVSLLSSYVKWLGIDSGWSGKWLVYLQAARCSRQWDLYDLSPPQKKTVFCVFWLLFVLFNVLFAYKCVLPTGDNPIAVNKYINQYHL